MLYLLDVENPTDKAFNSDETSVAITSQLKAFLNNLHLICTHRLSVKLLSQSSKSINQLNGKTFPY